MLSELMIHVLGISGLNFAVGFLTHKIFFCKKIKDLKK